MLYLDAAADQIQRTLGAETAKLLLGHATKPVPGVTGVAHL